MTQYNINQSGESHLYNLEELLTQGVINTDGNRVKISTIGSRRSKASTSFCFLMLSPSKENMTPSSSSGIVLLRARISFTVRANINLTFSAYASVRDIRARVIFLGSEPCFAIYRFCLFSCVLSRFLFLCDSFLIIVIIFALRAVL